MRDFNFILPFKICIIVFLELNIESQVRTTSETMLKKKMSRKRRRRKKKKEEGRRKENREKVKDVFVAYLLMRLC